MAVVGQCLGQRGEHVTEVTVENQPLEQQCEQRADAGSDHRLEKLPGARANHQVDAFDHQQDQESNRAGQADELQQNSGQRATGPDEILLQADGSSDGEGSQAHSAKQHQ